MRTRVQWTPEEEAAVLHNAALYWEGGKTIGHALQQAQEDALPPNRRRKFSYGSYGNVAKKLHATVARLRAERKSTKGE